MDRRPSSVAEGTTSTALNLSLLANNLIIAHCDASRDLLSLLSTEVSSHLERISDQSDDLNQSRLYKWITDR